MCVLVSARRAKEKLKEKAKEESQINFLLQQHPTEMDKFIIHYLNSDGAVRPSRTICIR